MNHMTNNQLSDALVPFCESEFFHMSSNIPYKQRYLGYFKAALIKFIDPALANYPSQYGYNFYDYDKIPTKIKMKTFLRYHTPTTLRPFLRAHFWKQGEKVKFPYYLTKDYLNMVFPSSELVISEFVDINKITDPDMLSRALSVELILTGKF